MWTVFLFRATECGKAWNNYRDRLYIMHCSKSCSMKRDRLRNLWMCVTLFSELCIIFQSVYFRNTQYCTKFKSRQPKNVKHTKYKFWKWDWLLQRLPGYPQCYTPSQTWQRAVAASPLSHPARHRRLPGPHAQWGRWAARHPSSEAAPWCGDGGGGRGRPGGYRLNNSHINSLTTRTWNFVYLFGINLNESMG